MSSNVRGFARKRVTWTSDGWMKDRAVNLKPENILESQTFTIQRHPIDTQW
jgi:hypothetical protein